MTHTPKQITEIYAWICTEPDGGDGTPSITFVLIGSDMARMESLEAYAQGVASKLGTPVRLVRFSSMEVIKEVQPER